LKTQRYLERIKTLADEAAALHDKHHYPVPRAVWLVLDGHGIFDDSVRKGMYSDICSDLGTRGANQAIANREKAKQEREAKIQKQEVSQDTLPESPQLALPF